MSCCVIATYFLYLISRTDVHIVGQGDLRPYLGGPISPQNVRMTFLSVFERLCTEQRRMTS